MERALWFVAPRRVEIRPEPLAELAAGDVQVRTEYSGISAGTEMLAYRGQLPPDLALDEALGALGGTFEYPFRYGYSCVGRVEACGADVTALAVGDLVFAFQPHQECFIAPADTVMPVPILDARIATLLPFVETALQVTLDAGSVLGETVVVCGAGVLGLLVAVLLERAGAAALVVEPQPWRRQLAGELGLPACSPTSVGEELARRDCGDGVPIVIEASGNPDALTGALELLAHEGTALVASWYGCRDVSLPLGGRFHRRRLTIRSTQVSTIPARLSGRWTPRRRLARAVAMAETLPLAALATDAVDFDDAPAAYQRVDEAPPGVMHVALGYR